MTRMPAKAIAIAIHVRAATGSRRKTSEAMAARKGDTLISTNVLATVVRVSDPMKKKNVPARNSPARMPGRPAARTAAGIRRPCMAVSTTATIAVMNSDRQNTISHAFVIDSWRTSRPPVDQQTAATIMNSTARRWRAAGAVGAAADIVNRGRAAGCREGGAMNENAGPACGEHRHRKRTAINRKVNVRPGRL